MKAMDIAAGHLEVSRRELARSGDLSRRRSVVSWALTDRRSMVIEDGKRLRGQAKETGLNPRVWDGH